MVTAKIAISLDRRLLQKIDQLVRKHLFPNRSKAIQTAVKEKMQRLDRNCLAKECAKLDPRFEKAMADEMTGLEHETWPEY